MADQPIYLTAEWERRLQVLWNRRNKFHATGPGVTCKASDDGITLTINPAGGDTLAGSTDNVLVKVTGTLAGGGFYSGSIWSGGLTVSGSSGLTLPGSGMTTSAGVLVLCTGENGASTHTLTTNSWHVGKKLPMGNSSGPIVAVNGGGSSLPTGTGKYKVLMLVDTLDPGTPGWDYPRFH